MNRSELVNAIRSKKSFLCVGLDSDKDRIPSINSQNVDPVLHFNREIIKATEEHAVAFKINTAFYEARGSRGWECLEKTVECIPDSHFLIIDAKRGDIGNTSEQYAEAFYNLLGVDALTVTPYMGSDSIKPFYRDDKWVIILALTSNKGAEDFQLQSMDGEEKLYQRVIRTSSAWGNEDNTMFVTGATRSSYLKDIRKMLPGHFLLVPGVGTQGGSLEEVCAQAMTDEVGLLINASRSIIFASEGNDFASEAKKAAASLHRKMKTILDQSLNT